MSCHPAVTATIPAPRLTRSDSDRSKTMTSWPARCRSAAVAHPAIDPPTMPTLMPLVPELTEAPPAPLFSEDALVLAEEDRYAVGGAGRGTPRVRISAVGH